MSISYGYAQNFKVNKIEPPNWWSGMKWNKVQLMVYGKNLKNISADFTNSKIKVLKIHNAASTDYSFIDIEIPYNAVPGVYKLILKKGNQSTTADFPILKRSSTKGKYGGFNQSDVIYLIMPDRFADGDTSNNRVNGMIDEYNLRSSIGRHGGDIQGIINHLDYIKNLGVTALWLNPVVENNDQISYHGYAATNLYKVDPRFGTNDLYKKLVKDVHADGMKIILDHVSNHVSIDHPWMSSLPFPDWINGTIQDHQMTHHDKLAFADIHRDSSTIINTTEGWFVNSMPDLNQANPFVSNYLIQNTLWWIESTGVDGIREDTYPYCNQMYLSKWAKAIIEEYPHFNIVGEVWTGDAVFLSSFQANSYYPKKFDSNLPSLTDFATYDVYTSFLQGKDNLSDIYEAFAKDFIYANPNNLVTFIDNHDVPRAMLQANGNVNRYKMALTMLLTSRGIPEIFYGTELGLKGGRDDGSIREDFPGGFPGDKRNAFIEDERTKQQNEIYNYVHNLLELRKENESLATGKLIEFPAANGIFVYFKISDKDRTMILMNENSRQTTVMLNQYKDQLKGIKTIKNLMTGMIYNIEGKDSVIIDAESGNIFQLIAPK